MASSSDITITNLTVLGVLPVGLDGQLVGVAPDGLLHSVHLRAGQALAYLTRSVLADAAIRNILVFGGSILALAEGSQAVELNWNLDTLRRVDLAGQSRGMSAFPKLDPLTGELHILTVASIGAQAHVVVSSGGLTRASRPIVDAPGRLTDLTIAGDRLVFVGDGFVGVASRQSASPITWIAGEAAPLLPSYADDFVSVGNWHLRFTNRTAVATDLLVDAATVRIPRAIPAGLHNTWIPATHQTTTTQGEIK